MENGDIKRFATAVHSMKSVLAYLEENEASAAAYNLEKAALKGDKDFMSANTESFIKTLETIIQGLDPQKSSAGWESNVKEDAVASEDALSSGEAAASEEASSSEDDIYLIEQLKKIRIACEDYNAKEAYAILDQLKEKSWKAETTAALERIRDTVYLHSDFEDACKQIDALQKKSEKVKGKSDFGSVNSGASELSPDSLNAKPPIPDMAINLAEELKERRLDTLKHFLFAFDSGREIDTDYFQKFTAFIESLNTENQLAKELIKAGQEEDAEKIRQILSAFYEEMKVQGTGGREQGTGDIADILQQIKQAIENGDMSTAGKKVNELGAVKLSPEERELYFTLYNALVLNKPEEALEELIRWEQK